MNFLKVEKFEFKIDSNSEFLSIPYYFVVFWLSVTHLMSICFPRTNQSSSLHLLWLMVYEIRFLNNDRFLCDSQLFVSFLSSCRVIPGNKLAFYHNSLVVIFFKEQNMISKASSPFSRNDLILMIFELCLHFVLFVVAWHSAYWKNWLASNGGIH